MSELGNYFTVEDEEKSIWENPSKMSLLTYAGVISMHFRGKEKPLGSKFLDLDSFTECAGFLHTELEI